MTSYKKAGVLCLLGMVVLTTAAPRAKAVADPEAAPDAMATDPYRSPYHTPAVYHPSAQYLQPIYHPIYKPDISTFHPRGNSVHNSYHAKPVYHKPKPVYHKPELVFHKPEPAYHKPKYNHKPEPVYREPKYHKPEPKYHKPEPKYPKPEAVYHPEPSYHPESIYKAKSIYKHDPYKSHHHDYKYERKPYAFDYGVKDQYTGANFGHSETSDGKNVQGSYSVALPDGRIQHVKYIADDHNGYQAEVTYEGEAHYPEYHGGHYNGGPAGYKPPHHNSYSPYH